jgi:hypothetical protein
LQTIGSAHPQVNIAARDLKGTDDEPVLAASTTTTSPPNRGQYPTATFPNTM